jgi:DNA-binding transcriptional ArsR family regulator
MVTDLLARVRAEIDARREELRPAVAEHERLLAAVDALGIGAGAGKASTRPSRAPARKAATATAAAAAPTVSAALARGRARAPRGAAQQAIVAALEHGSHTVSELAVVTAMPAPNIRENLRRLTKAGAVTRARREGKAAYALSSTARR